MGDDGKSRSDYWLNRALGVFLSKDRIRFYLLIILILGFALRLIAALNLSVSADDMHFSVHAINFLNSGKLVVYDQSASLWYYLTDIFYKFFGITQMASRMAALFFGTFTILIVFFIAREFFGNKSGIIAAFLLAISPFHIKYTISEMDNMAMFFAMFSILLFVWALKQDKNKLFIFSGALLGLALLTKVYTLLFIPVLLAYSIYSNKKQNKAYLDKKLLKKLFIFLIFAFLFAIPSLTHNYLLYKDKGILDLIYTNALGIGKEESAQFYSWDTGFGQGADWLGFLGLKKSIHSGDNIPTSIYPFLFIWKNDQAVLVLGILGILFLIRSKKREYPVLFGLMLIFVFTYLAARILLAKHYIFLLLFLIIPASYSLSCFDDFIKKKIPKFRIRYLLLLLLIFSLIILGLRTPFTLAPYYTKSEIGQLISYKEAGIPEESLIIGDSRIYRGQIHWAFQGREYIEASMLPSLLSASQKTGRASQVPVYFVECVVDDCGWGTVKDQPEFNASMEEMVKLFSSQGKLEKEIYSSTFSPKSYPFSSDKGNLHFRIYKASLPIDKGLYPQLKSSKVWFLYPIAYDESISPIFDKYKVSPGADELLNSFAHLIIYISILLAFLSLLASVYLFLEIRS